MPGPIASPRIAPPRVDVERRLDNTIQVEQLHLGVPGVIWARQ
jgi:hypothetical protein